jgi:hypothetical protein
MKRWGLVWVVAILSCIPIVLHRGKDPGMLADTDTAFLLRILRERQDPLYWFTHDWPLMNHFYRPISTLTFEFDNAFHLDNAAGYGFTNAILCCICVFLVGWLMRELTDSIPISAASMAIFGLWTWDGIDGAAPVIRYLAVAIGFFGLFRHGFKVWFWLPAVGAIWYLGYEASGMADLRFRMIEWLPGRTASTMAIFCLISMAAYARYERTSAVRREAVPTSLDEPAGTRSSVQLGASPKAPWLWALLAVGAGAFALASYEQAVMLPAALLALAVSLKLQRYQVRWAWHGAFWALLGGYFMARQAYLPAGVSGYQDQQILAGIGGTLVFLSGYVFPAWSSLISVFNVLDLGASVLLTSTVYSAAWSTFANLAGFLAARRHWVLALTGFALSVVAYLPMAWLHQFEHYHYWPMALRSLFVVVLGWGAWELAVIAVSPPSRQAPQRLSPAPGSLPRR